MNRAGSAVGRRWAVIREPRVRFREESEPGFVGISRTDGL